MYRVFDTTWRQALRLLRPSFLRPSTTYTKEDFKADVTAGVTVAIMQVPQSMALALIAGLPAVYGLYASIPGFLASFWGSSRQLSTGPVAITSFLTLTALLPLASPASPDYIRLAAALALLVGIIYLLIGLFRLGFILHLVPSSVITGFSTAAAAIIVISQLPNLLSIPITQHEFVLLNIRDLLQNIQSLTFIALMVALASIGALFAARRLPRTFPAPLALLSLGIFAGYFLHLGDHGIPLVGAVPQSLPSFTFPTIGFDEFLQLLPRAVIIALVSFIQAHAAAKVAAKKTGEKLDSNQELVGQGIANTVTSVFQGFPLGGSFTRTLVNVEAGARTGIASFVTACITVVALLFIAPLFFYLPKAVLATIVIVSAIPLIDFSQLKHMYAISRIDGFVAYLTCAIAFIFKPDDAIFIGIVAALILFIERTVWGVRVVDMGIDERWNVLRGHHADIEEMTYFPGVTIVRVGLSLYYANTAHITHLIDERITLQETRENIPVTTLVMDASGINFIDVTALEVLGEYIKDLREERHIKVAMIYARRPVLETLLRAPEFPPITILHNIAEMREYLEAPTPIPMTVVA